MDQRAAVTLLLLWLAATAPGPDVHAYSTGAPARDNDGTCTTLLPGHRNTAARPGPSPFTLAPAQNGVARGDALNVTLTSRHGFSFKGFLVQARAAGTQQPLGSFTVYDADNTHTIDCLGGTTNAVTHSNPSLKNSTTFEWTPPADFNGQVVFNATVVQDYSTYWSSVAAQALVGDPALTGSTAGISTTQRPVTTQRTTTTGVPATSRPHLNYRALNPIYVGCGSSKTCFGYPGNCESKGNCDFMVTALERGSKYEFELMTTGKDAKYVAVGLSNDKVMAEDLVMECVLSSTGGVKVYQSWNIPKNPNRGNERVPTNNDMNLLNSSYIDNIIYCHFERNDKTVVKGVEFNLPEKEYFLLMATGTQLKEGDAVGFHDIQFVSSDGKGLLSDVNGFKLASKLYIRLHGAFMIGAWIGAASIGIVLARYFKQTWTGSQFCGKDQWFAWHRIFMILVWSLTIAAFVLIFVELQDWSSAKNHAILGVITTALAFFQPIGAIFRPSPDSRRRPIFNWAHWFVGNCAHIFGIVTIFLAGQLAKAELPKWWIWVLVGYVAFHVLMHLMFSVAGCISERQSSKRINSFPMKEMTSSRTPLSSAERKQEAPHSCFRKFLLAVYIFGILVITIALIVIVAVAPVDTFFQKWITNTNSSG